MAVGDFLLNNLFIREIGYSIRNKNSLENKVV